MPFSFFSVIFKMDASNNELEKVIETEFRDGQITPQGWVNDKGELLPRAKTEPRMGLTPEQEMEIDQWNKQLKRDFPDVDISWIDMVATYCYMHPEESKAYALSRMNEAAPVVKAEAPFREMHAKYERVHT